jgi:hypothetical protein
MHGSKPFEKGGSIQGNIQHIDLNYRAAQTPLSNAELPARLINLE